MQFARKKTAVPPARGKSTPLKTALYQVLFGIEDRWQLGQQELAAILHRSASTISDWKKNEAVAVSQDRPSPNDAQIYEFIELYDSVSSLFVRLEDQIRWLTTPSPDFHSKSPLQLLKASPKNLYALREWVDHFARP